MFDARLTNLYLQNQSDNDSASNWGVQTALNRCEPFCKLYNQGHYLLFVLQLSRQIA